MRDDDMIFYKQWLKYDPLMFIFLGLYKVGNYYFTAALFEDTIDSDLGNYALFSTG